MSNMKPILERLKKAQRENDRSILPYLSLNGDKVVIHKPTNILIGGVLFVVTCSACPEQYDAYIGKKMAGYLRLRHGHFTVTCPDVDGTEVYSHSPEGDGVFTEDERFDQLTLAAAAIKQWASSLREEKKMTSPKDKVAATPIKASWMPREPVEHRVKSWTHLFAGFVEGRKFHDMRNHDCDFRVGDTVVLREWDAYEKTYTGREERRVISYITRKLSPCALSPEGLKPGYCILSLIPEAT